MPRIAGFFGLLLLAVLPTLCECNDVYIYAFGYSREVWRNETFEQLTLVTPNDAFWGGNNSLYGRLDRLCATFLSAAAVIDGSKLYTWGRASMTGRGSITNENVGPHLVHDFSPLKIVSLDNGDTDTILVLDNGTVYTWGTNNRTNIVRDDQPCHSCFLGRGDGVLDSYVLEEIDRSNMILKPGEKVVKAVSNSMSMFLLTSSGNVYTYGSNKFHSLGQSWTIGNAPSYHNTATIVELDGLKPSNLVVVDIASNVETTVFLLNDGSYMCYGKNMTFCSGTAGNNDAGGPTHYQPPPGVSFRRLVTVTSATYGWDQHGDIWGWGRAQSLPSLDNADCLSQGTCSPRKLSRLNSAKIIELSHVDEVAIFALTERYEVWILCIVNVWHSSACAGGAWSLFDYKTPSSSYVPYISHTTMSSHLFVGSVKLAPVCSPIYPPFPHPDFVCSSGIWTLFSPSSTVNSSAPVFHGAPVIIRGNLTIGNLTTTLHLNAGAGITVGTGKPPFISIDGCLILNSTLQLDLELTQQTLGTPKKGQTYPTKDEEITIGLIEFDSNCPPPPLDSLQLSYKKPTSGPSCKKYKLGKMVLSEPVDGRRLLHAVLVVNSSGCNVWWIVVASTVGSVIVITAILAIILLGIRKAKSKKEQDQLDAD